MDVRKSSWVSGAAKNLKRRVRKRDKVCRICHSDEKLRVCHIKPRRLYPSLTLVDSNVILLCWICDWDYGERLEEPWIKRKYEMVFVKAK